MKRGGAADIGARDVRRDAAGDVSVFAIRKENYRNVAKRN
jgi:hypothetical protein